MRQFYSPDFTQIDGETAHHIINVLKHGVNDVINVFDGEGTSGSTEITEINPCPPLVKLRLLQKEKHPPQDFKIHIFQAVIKPRAMGLCLEKCTELGVSRFTPIRCERSFRQKISRRHLEKIMISACEQTGIKYLPSLDETINFLISIKDWKKEKTPGYILSCGETPFFLRGGVSSVSIFTGPEGGFTDRELEEARKVGLIAVSVGDNVLRSETASIAAAAICRGGRGGRYDEIKR